MRLRDLFAARVCSACSAFTYHSFRTLCTDFRLAKAFFPKGFFPKNYGRSNIQLSGGLTPGTSILSAGHVQRGRLHLPIIVLLRLRLCHHAIREMWFGATARLPSIPHILSRLRAVLASAATRSRKAPEQDVQLRGEILNQAPGRKQRQQQLTTRGGKRKTSIHRWNTLSGSIKRGMRKVTFFQVSKTGSTRFERDGRKGRQRQNVDNGASGASQYRQETWVTS